MDSSAQSATACCSHGGSSAYIRQLLRLPQQAALQRRCRQAPPCRAAATAPASAGPQVYEPVKVREIGFPYGDTFCSQQGDELPSARVLELMQPFALDARVKRIDQVLGGVPVLCCAV